MVRVVALLLLLSAACGNITRKADDGGVLDDARRDGMPMTDGAVDAPPDAPPIPPQSREVVNGAGRASSATYTFDVQIGNAVKQAPISSTTYSIEGHSSVKP